MDYLIYRLTTQGLSLNSTSHGVDSPIAALEYLQRHQRRAWVRPGTTFVVVQTPEVNGDNANAMIRVLQDGSFLTLTEEPTL